jgi:signal peptidase I
MKSVKPQNQKADEKPSRAKRVQREIIAWMWIILVFLLVNGAIGQARVIPSGSMENTLLIGDHLIMSRVGYDAGVPFTSWHVSLWRNPKRRQIVIFTPVVRAETSDIIKRVVGLPGETVDIHDGAVWIDGRKLVENYTTGPSEPYQMHTPYKVPPDCYFVMGDNRGDSYDSRFTGCVPRKNIIGTPVLIYMSVDASPDAWEPGQIRERFLAYANALIHPSEVRWQRLFKTF